MEILLFGLSFSYAAVAMEIQVHLTIMVVDAAVTIVAYGLSFYSSSAVADVVEMVSANMSNKKATVYPSLFLFSFDLFLINKAVLFDL